MVCRGGRLEEGLGSPVPPRVSGPPGPVLPKNSGISQCGSMGFLLRGFAGSRSSGELVRSSRVFVPEIPGFLARLRSSRRQPEARDGLQPGRCTRRCRRPSVSCARPRTSRTRPSVGCTRPRTSRTRPSVGCTRPATSRRRPLVSCTRPTTYRPISRRALVSSITARARSASRGSGIVRSSIPAESLSERSATTIQ